MYLLQYLLKVLNNTLHNHSFQSQIQSGLGLAQWYSVFLACRKSSIAKEETLLEVFSAEWNILLGTCTVVILSHFRLQEMTKVLVVILSCRCVWVLFLRVVEKIGWDCTYVVCLPQVQNLLTVTQSFMIIVKPLFSPFIFPPVQYLLFCHMEYFSLFTGGNWEICILFSRWQAFILTMTC